MLANLTQAAQSDERASESAWLAKREPKNIDLVLITSDKGLAGAFNSNLIKSSQRFIDEHPDAKISLTLVGRKGRDFYKRRSSTIIGEYVNILAKPAYADAANVAREIIRRYRDAETDAVYVINNDFKSVMTQTLSVQQLLPVDLAPSSDPAATRDYIYEQSPLDMLERLMPRYVEVAIFRAMLETGAAEHAARMTAMDKASSNAKDVIEALTLYMNRVRQAAITKEIIEVVSGAAAAS